MLGEYPPSGLTYEQVVNAKAGLEETLDLVLGNDYSPPSPIRYVAANRSVDELAPDNPIAAELTQMRETLDEIHKRITSRAGGTSSTAQKTINALRNVIERNINSLTEDDWDILFGKSLSDVQNTWARELLAKWQELQNG